MDLCFVERPEILKELEARVPADACFIGMTWEARRALRQSRRRLLDARAPFFLRASLDVLSKEGGDPFPLTFVGSAAPGAPGAMEESLGPTKAWRPPKRSFRRDVLLRKLFNGLAAVAGIGRRSGRPRSTGRFGFRGSSSRRVRTPGMQRTR